MAASSLLDLKSIQINTLSADFKIDKFRCGVDEIDRWVKGKAQKHHKLNRTKVFCAFLPGSLTVSGFYCLSFSSEDANKVGAQHRDIYRPTGVPLIYITYLAVVRGLQNQGLGSFMLLDALRRAYLVSQHVAFYGVGLRSLNDRTTKLYTKLGFGAVDDEQFPLMILPVWTLNDLFSTLA
jgi:ribosomal protein S18 acetylase RimI-like enzyme